MEEPQVQEPQMQEPHVQEPHVQETQTNKHITFDVPKTKPAVTKNPGRVAAGKRLAERNRLAREAKKKKTASRSRSRGRSQKSSGNGGTTI